MRPVREPPPSHGNEPRVRVVRDALTHPRLTATTHEHVQPTTGHAALHPQRLIAHALEHASGCSTLPGDSTPSRSQQARPSPSMMPLGTPATSMYRHHDERSVDDAPYPSARTGRFPSRAHHRRNPVSDSGNVERDFRLRQRAPQTAGCRPRPDHENDRPHTLHANDIPPSYPPHLHVVTISAGMERMSPQHHWASAGDH